MLQDIFDNLYDTLPEFPKKKELHAIFSKKNITMLVQRDEDRMDAAFETEVIKAELAFFANEQNLKTNDFIFYWNQPHGVYPVVVPLLAFPEYTYYIVKQIRSLWTNLHKKMLTPFYHKD